MTDLQVRYQQVELEKAKLAEERRLHDAQISQAVATAAKLGKEEGQIEANTRRLLAEAGLTEAELNWYGAKTVSEIVGNYARGFSDVLKGFGSIMPG